MNVCHFKECLTRSSIKYDGRNNSYAHLMICMLDRNELNSESAFHCHPFPPFCNNCNSYVKGCNLASRDYLPQFVESLGAQEKFESAQCSVSMRE